MENSLSRMANKIVLIVDLESRYQDIMFKHDVKQHRENALIYDVFFSL